MASGTRKKSTSKKSKGGPKVSATAFAPATTGNVGVGFDILGLALETIGDTVTATRTSRRGLVEIEEIQGATLPLQADQNTATAGIIELLRDLSADFGVNVKIKKEIPLGSGMGGSAASAVAGIVAANALLKKPLSKDALFRYALIGEKVATGSIHGDNVAPCLFGGLTLVQSVEPVRVVDIPTPKNLHVVIVIPNARLDTKEARRILKREVPLEKFVGQSARLAGFISGLFKKDFTLIQESFEDIVIEPQRAPLIKGFTQVKEAALNNGALGCTISGAGPAVFAFTLPSRAKKIKEAMIQAFDDAGAGPARGWTSPISKKGAHLL